LDAQHSFDPGGTVAVAGAAEALHGIPGEQRIPCEPGTPSNGAQDDDQPDSPLASQRGEGPHDASLHGSEASIPRFASTEGSLPGRGETRAEYRPAAPAETRAMSAVWPAPCPGAVTSPASPTSPRSAGCHAAATFCKILEVAQSVIR